MHDEEAKASCRFEAFIVDLASSVRLHINDPTNLAIFKNPAYVIQTAHLYIADNDEAIAEHLFAHAYEMDRPFGYFALYFLALAKLKKGEKLYEVHKQRTDANTQLHAEAKECLQKAISLAQQMMGFMSGVNVTMVHDPTTELARQITNTITLSCSFIYNCKVALATITDCDNNHPHSVVKFKNYESLDEGHRKYADAMVAQQKMGTENEGMV